MLERVRKTISRYNMLPRGSRVIVAVSGGPDSVCLLHLLTEIAPELDLTVEAAHLNHQLRGEESDADEQFVKDLAARLGVNFHVARADVAAHVKTEGGNLEQAARLARQEFFRRLAPDANPGIIRIATGHTRDDQAETVLFRILRGSGLAGLAGIHPVTASAIVRPLLEVSRADILQFLEERGAAWREDSSNRDLRFSRNAIRRELLPELSSRWNPKLSEALAQLADITFEEERWWRSEDSPLAAIPQVCAAGGIELDIRTLVPLPKAVQRRAIRRAISAAKGDLRQIDFEHVERVLELAMGHEGTGRLELPDLDVRRSFDWIRLAARGRRVLRKAELVGPAAVSVPGCCPSPDGKSLIQLDIVDANPPPEACANLTVVRLDVSKGLCLRGWKPGDRYRPKGQSRVRKLKEMFSEARVPSWQRRYWPILINGEEILWSRQFGAAEGAAEGPGSAIYISERGRISEGKS